MNVRQPAVQLLRLLQAEPRQLPWPRFDTQKRRRLDTTHDVVLDEHAVKQRLFAEEQKLGLDFTRPPRRP